MNNKIKMCCPCHFGLESVLNFEIKKAGGQDIHTDNGKITFFGDFNTLARANMCLSTAERVLIELAEFEALTFEDLFQGVKKIPLENYVGKKDAFPVKGYSLNSQLHSVPDCQKIIKKACVERLKEKYGLGWFEETGTTYQIQFSLMNDKATIYLDTSGIGLHKRGYRRNSNAAPIKETLAAGICDLARIRPDSIVCDAFCGSGTFLIESAIKALNIAPGINRHFAAEKWNVIPQSVWREERQRAIAAVNKDADFYAFGYDIDEAAVQLSIENARKAGVKSRIRIEKADVADFRPPEGAICISNPPYGERMLEIKQAEQIYKEMGKVYPANSENHTLIISPHEEFEKFFGKRADKKRKLYNGMIKCQLYMYFNVSSTAFKNT